jgi:hypothetical protein
MERTTLLALLALSPIAAILATIVVVAILRRLTSRPRLIYVLGGLAVPLVVFVLALLFPQAPQDYATTVAFAFAAFLTPATLLTSAFLMRASR